MGLAIARYCENRAYLLPLPARTCEFYEPKLCTATLVRLCNTVRNHINAAQQLVFVIDQCSLSNAEKQHLIDHIAEASRIHNVVHRSVRSAKARVVIEFDLSTFEPA